MIRWLVMLVSGDHLVSCFVKEFYKGKSLRHFKTCNSAKEYFANTVVTDLVVVVVLVVRRKSKDVNHLNLEVSKRVHTLEYSLLEFDRSCWPQTASLERV